MLRSRLLLKRIVNIVNKKSNKYKVLTDIDIVLIGTKHLPLVIWCLITLKFIITTIQMSIFERSYKIKYYNAKQSKYLL